MERTRFEQELNDLMLGGRLAESSSPKFDYDASVSSSIPALTKPIETVPSRQTLYVNISLDIGNAPDKVDQKTGKAAADATFYKVEPLTGIFVPKNFAPQKEVDVLLYLHGYKGASPGNSVSINGYWNADKVQHFALREEVNRSGRNIILVAPTLGPLSQAGNLTTAKGFDNFLTQTLAALNEHFLRKNSLTEVTGFGKIIIAGHSGGGSPMLRIAELKGSANVAKISECWGFDSVYGEVEKRWVEWAAARPNAKLYFYSASTIDRSRTLKKLAESRKLKNICVYQWSGKDFSDWEKSRPPLKKSSVGPHFWIPVVYLKERLQNMSCRAAQTPAAAGKGNASTPKTESVPVVAPNYGDIPDANYRLTAVGLSEDKIKVASAGAKKTYVEIQESPSVFLPKIVANARALAIKDKKNDIADKLDSDQWFKRFTCTTFLGRPLKDEQYLHVEMAKMLKFTETEFMKMLGSNDAAKTGDILLNNSKEGISGSRKTSSTATFSMHMFGLAVDVNYLGNPYIESANDISSLNDTLKNAALLMNSDVLIYEKGKKGKFKDRFDYVSAMDKTLETYFGLLDAQTELERHLQNSQSSVWNKLSLSEAKTLIQKNLTVLACLLERGKSPECSKKSGQEYLKNPQKWDKYKEHFKKNAILDFDKRFVVGMEALNFAWGGYYGDMMHFDMRKIGVGFYIEKARNEYGAKVKNQAARLLKEKKYGNHQAE